MADLDVWLFDQMAGQLSENGKGVLTFAYSPDWIDAGMPPLSQRLPVRPEAFGDDRVRPFFDGLLPEGDARRMAARRVGVSPGNVFGLLAALAGDTAGAVSVLAPGAPVPKGSEEDVRWLDEAELAAAVRELPRRPLFADVEEGIRLSLAGVQDKMPVVVREGAIGITNGRFPSTHILKAPIARLEDTIANEAFCLELAARVGLIAASAEQATVSETEFLLVRRYDRRLVDGQVQRLHQEDFCQALGIPPDRKYEAEGGPGIATCASLLRACSTLPAVDVIAFVDAVTFNFLIGNHDAHGKNYSVLYTPDGARLAPLYDLISTAAYHGLSRKMAMKIGGDYRPDWVRRRHIARMAAGAGLGEAAVRRRMRQLARVARDQAAELLEQFRARGADRPVLERVVALVRSRGLHLTEELG